MSQETYKKTIKENLTIYLNSGVTIEDLKEIIRELEKEQTLSKKGGRPLGVGNTESQLLPHFSTIRDRLTAQNKRGDIAAALGVSRQTLNEFIVRHLPDFHRAKKT